MRNNEREARGWGAGVKLASSSLVYLLSGWVGVGGGGGSTPIVDYTYRLLQKGVPFSR